MSLTSLFLIYAVAFRLAIITVGAISIILGYKLFCRRVFDSSHEKSSATMTVSGLELSLINAAPGTIFATFGAVVVIVMLFQGNPQLTLETLNKVASSTDEVGARNSSTGLTLRGQETDSLKKATMQGLEFEQQGDIHNAIKAYEQAAETMAEPLNDLAWLYQADSKLDKLEDAASLSTLAVAMRKDPRFLDTLAEIKFKSGDRDSAVKLEEKAVALSSSPQYKDKLMRFKNVRP